MTITGAHHTVYNPYVRALFTISNRRTSFQLLSNPEHVVRADWNWFRSYKGLTLTRISL